MDQQNAAVLQERTKPGHVKLPKRLPSLAAISQSRVWRPMSWLI
jgi:hypothetical protein